MALGLSVNEQIYKFLLKQKLGVGCFGEVWLAHDNSIDSDVAVKVIDPQGVINIECFKEARIGNRFNHDNLVKVHYADLVKYHDGRDFIIIVMDYLRNGSILNHLNSRGFLPLNDSIRLMRNVLFGLDYLHRLGFQHNDIKPGNILLGNSGEAVLTDYGIARTSGDPSVVQSYLLHQAPELKKGSETSVATDIFQCGMTAFRLLCGESFVTGKWRKLGPDKYADLISKGKLITKSSFPFYIPERVKRVVLKAIAINPEERYSSAYQMLQELEKLAYAGYWTSDATNQFVGRKNNSCNTYRFEMHCVGGTLFDFNAYVRYPSGREVGISRFTMKSVCKKDVLKLQSEFGKWVVNGEC